MPYLEIYTEDWVLLKRIKKVLSDEVEISITLMECPQFNITLPIEYYEYLGNGLKRVILYCNDWVFSGIVFSLNTNKQDETIEVTVSHELIMWNFRETPTNKAIKEKTIPEIYEDKEMYYEKGWNISYDEKAKNHEIDYVYSRLGKLDALTKTCELTDDIWWRLSLRERKKVDVGVFGENSGYMLSKKPNGKHNIQILAEPEIEEDYSNVINLATVYAEKSDGGVTALSLREVYNDEELQDEDFPVIIINNWINNEREYDYAQYPKMAPNTQLEYAILDTVGLAAESGRYREGSFAFNDLSPFSIEEASEEAQGQAPTTNFSEWVVPAEQRLLSAAERETNSHSIWSFFHNTGWSDLAIKALLANIWRESSANPNVYEGFNAGNIGGGFGLVQWTPSTNVTNWLRARGYSVQDYGKGECEKIKEEWSQGQQWIATAAYNLSFRDWSVKKDASLEWMTTAFLMNYERPYSSVAAMNVSRTYFDEINRLVDKWTSEAINNSAEVIETEVPGP